MVYVIGVCDAHIVVTVCLKVEHVLAKQNVIMNTFSIKKKIYIYTMWKSANRIPVLSLVTSNSRFNKIVV